MAIIAVLASLLLPALWKAKDRARNIVCVNNLRQIHLPFSIAFAEDDGRELNRPTPYLDSVDRTNLMSRPLFHWFEQEWGKTNKGWICPSAPDRPLARRKTSPFYPPEWNATYPGSIDTAWWVQREYNSWGPPGIYSLGDRRAGSYAHNNWLRGGWFWGGSAVPRLDYTFMTDDQIQHPSSTPDFGDGVLGWLNIGVGSGARSSTPQATDLPASNLQFGAPSSFPPGMGVFAIPRHGSRPSVASTNHSASDLLPGAINMSFWHGHVEQVKLERLWRLSWHRNYQAPQKRPGL